MTFHPFDHHPLRTIAVCAVIDAALFAFGVWYP